MTDDPITPIAIAIAAVSFLLDRASAWLRRRTTSKWHRLYEAIQIGVNAAWESYVRRITNNPDHIHVKLDPEEVKQAHDIALSVAEQHALKTCPKLWRKLTNAEKSFLIKRAIQDARANSLS